MTKRKKKAEKGAMKPLKSTDTLPSESKTSPEKQAEVAKKPKKRKIIGLMGFELQEGPPGSSHG